MKTYILDKEDNIVGKDEKVFSIAGGSKTEINQSILTYSPLLWDIDAPNLYTMVSELYENDSLVDSQKNTFGFRTIAINKIKDSSLTADTFRCTALATIKTMPV